MGKPKQKYRKRHRQEADRIHAEVVEFIRREGKVGDNEDRLFNLFGDAYERGYCGALYYRLYVDTGRKEPIVSRPKVCGDTIVAYAMEKGFVRCPSEEDRKELGSMVDYWWRQFDRARHLWDAWAYVWHKLEYRHRCCRRHPEDPIPIPRKRSESSEEFPLRRVWEY